MAWPVLLEWPDVPANRLMADALGRPLGQPGEGRWLIAVGPEGGWTREERIQGETAGWQLVSLGPAICGLKPLRRGGSAMVGVTRLFLRDGGGFFFRGCDSFLQAVYLRLHLLQFRLNGLGCLVQLIDLVLA